MGGFAPYSQCNDASTPGAFLGDKRGKIYHGLSCLLVLETPQCRSMWFTGSADSKICGYTPCRICRP